MKTTLLSLILPAIFFSFLLSGCIKLHSSKADNPYGLPNATQEGKNTLGFLLNEEPWTPKGVRGTGNLSIDYDHSINNGQFNIVAYNFIPTISEQFKIGVGDSLNFVTGPRLFNFSNNSLAGIGFTNYACGYYFSWDSNTSVSGSMKITKLDRTNRIISGTFNTTLSKPGCPEIKITDGRFDMKF